MKKYTGQTLAIVLIILIIGVIVALGIASRTNKSSLRNFEEKKSQDASEVVSSVIDISRSVVTNEILSNCEDEFALGNECCINYTNGILDAQNFVNVPDQSVFPTCTYSNVPDNFVRLCFEPVYDVDDFTLVKDEVINFSFPSPTLTTASCNKLDFTFKKVGSAGGVVVSKIYSQRDLNGYVTSYKPYSTADFLSFKLATADPGWLGTWTAVSDPYSWSFMGTEFVQSPYLINNLRVRAVGSDIVLSMKADACTMDPFFMKVTASSNCSGTYRSSYYYRPLQNGALSLFDFTLYNKNGDMKFTF
jgi:hypothetical protein